MRISIKCGVYMPEKTGLIISQKGATVTLSICQHVFSYLLLGFFLVFSVGSGFAWLGGDDI